MSALIREFLLAEIVLLPGFGCAEHPTYCEDGNPALSSSNESGGHSLTVAMQSSAVYSVDFGPTALEQIVTGAILFQNIGCVPLTVITTTAPTDAEFSLTLQAGTVVYSDANADGGISVPVSFKPFSTGQKSATVTIQTDSAPSPTVTVHLAGTGLDGG